jgi:hypothetical protein
MSISMALYVGESSFSSLEKVTQQTKAMLESWTVNDNTSIKKDIDFNPVIPNTNFDRRLNNNEISRKDYEQYGWLFGVK